MHGVAVDLHKAHTYILYDWGSSKDAYCMHLHKSGLPWAVLTHILDITLNMYVLESATKNVMKLIWNKDKRLVI